MDIVNVAKARGDIFSGSFMQEILLKKGYSRAFADIDTLSLDPQLTGDVLAGTRKNIQIVEQKITDSPAGKFSIYRVKQGKNVLADLDPIQYAEEGFALKYGLIEFDGLKFLNPKARLAAKIKQFGRGKYGTDNKVITDIKGLTGNKLDIDLNKATLTGPYGYTSAELGAYTGMTGPLTTSARGLFTFFTKEKVITDISGKGYGLFATPFDIKTKQPMTRISRLGIDAGTEASMIDILSGDVTFRKGKPQIVIFENQKIGDTFKVIYKSSELEVEGGLGKIAKQKERLGTTLLFGRRVPIISAVIEDASILTANTKSLLGKAKQGTISINEQAKLLKNLEKETGISYSSEYKSPPYVSPYRVPPIVTYQKIKTEQPSLLIVSSYKPSSVKYGAVTSYSLAPSVQYKPSIFSGGISTSFSPSKQSIGYKPSQVSQPSKPSKPSYPSYPSYPTPSRPTPSTPPTKIISYPRQKLSTPKLSKGRYTVEVRRFGKFKTIATTSDLNSALNIGKRKVGSTLAATFRVRGGNVGTPFGFYKKQTKGGTLLIEQPKFRLSTGTEKMEIKGYRKLRKNQKGGRII
jgi:hypothetical protein